MPLLLPTHYCNVDLDDSEQGNPEEEGEPTHSDEKFIDDSLIQGDPDKEDTTSGIRDNGNSDSESESGSDSESSNASNASE